MRRVTLLLLGAIQLSACFHYVPTSGLSQPQGTPVRARLSTPSAFELSEFTVNEVQQVDGEMIGVDATNLLLSATWLDAVSGRGFEGGGWTVRIPQANVSVLERKAFSWVRTGILLGGLAVGTSLGFGAFGVWSGGDLPPGSGSGGAPL